MVDYIEATKDIKFANGFNPNVECIRLAFDPVIASHRPLVYYAVSSLLVFRSYNYSIVAPKSNNYLYLFSTSCCGSPTRLRD